MKIKIIIGLSIILFVSLGVNIYAIKSILTIINNDPALSASTNILNFENGFSKRIEQLGNNLTEAENTIRATNLELEKLTEVEQGVYNTHKQLGETHRNLGETNKQLQDNTDESLKLNRESISTNIDLTERIRNFKNRIQEDYEED